MQICPININDKLDIDIIIYFMVRNAIMLLTRHIMTFFGYPSRIATDRFTFQLPASIYALFRRQLKALTQFRLNFSQISHSLPFLRPRSFQSLYSYFLDPAQFQQITKSPFSHFHHRIQFQSQSFPIPIPDQSQFPTSSYDQILSLYGVPYI